MSTLADLLQARDLCAYACTGALAAFLKMQKIDNEASAKTLRDYDHTQALIDAAMAEEHAA